MRYAVMITVILFAAYMGYCQRKHISQAMARVYFDEGLRFAFKCALTNDGNTPNHTKEAIAFYKEHPENTYAQRYFRELRLQEENKRRGL